MINIKVEEYLFSIVFKTETILYFGESNQKSLNISLW